MIASNHPAYSAGDIVLARTGWCTHALSDRADLRKLDPGVAPLTTGLGVPGMPGFTAYGGLRVPVCGLIAQYSGVAQGDGTDRLPATMLQILSKRLTVRGFLNYDFAAEHVPAFLREVCAGIAAGRIRSREDFVDSLERAPEAFIGMLEGRNFGKLIVRVDG